MIETRPTVAADLAFVSAVPLPFRTKFITLLVDGEIIGVGGLVFRPDGTVWIAAYLTPAARRARVALHKAGLAVMREARARGLKRLYAVADATAPRAEAWMIRCGLTPTEIFDNGQRVFMWTAS